MSDPTTLIERCAAMGKVVQRHHRNEYGGCWQGRHPCTTCEAAALAVQAGEALAVAIERPCKDCCCARSWEALGEHGTHGVGSIYQRIEDVVRENAALRAAVEKEAPGE
jgi:hypothetical protein